MHGPTWIFWASLTPFSPQLKGIRGARAAEAQKKEDQAAAAAAEAVLAQRGLVARTAADRRATSGKARHVKAKGALYTLAGAGDDVVAATVRAAQARGVMVMGWARCPHDWIYCTGRCDAPPSDDEDDDGGWQGAAAAQRGSCCDLVSPEEAWAIPEQWGHWVPEPEPEQSRRLVFSRGALDAALDSLGMLASMGAEDDRGRHKPSDRKGKVAERRRERAADLEENRAERAAERRTAALAGAVTSFACAPVYLVHRIATEISRAVQK
jgi:hypothetical protein